MFNLDKKVAKAALKNNLPEIINTMIQVKTSRNETAKKTDRVIIQAFNATFTITATPDGYLCINKTDFDNNRIEIAPVVSNEINIK